MLRIYLSGRISIEGEALLGPSDFPGPQGQVAFAYLVLNRRGPVSRGTLADVLWHGRPPRSWDSALSAIVSRLRSLLNQAGVDGAATLTGAHGAYEMRLPAGTWIDHEAAVEAIHEAEALIAGGDFKKAYGPSAVARLVARRPFLPGQDSRFIEERRQQMDSVLVRALECRSRVYLWNDEFPLAAEAARELLALRPLWESGYRLLMRAHTEAGNAAEALRVYEECRQVIADELGVGPSPETRALHAEVLKAV